MEMLEKERLDRLKQPLKKVSDNETHHFVDIIHLNVIETMMFPLDETMHRCISENEPRKIKSLLKQFLEVGLESPKKCSLCGALVPDLCLVHKGKEYYFTCTKILDEDNKILAETDYRKFGAYCQAISQKEERRNRV